MVPSAAPDQVVPSGAASRAVTVTDGATGPCTAATQCIVAGVIYYKQLTLLRIGCLHAVCCHASCCMMVTVGRVVLHSALSTLAWTSAGFAPAENV
jgi:hypothetical protein